MRDIYNGPNSDMNNSRVHIFKFSHFPSWGKIKQIGLMVLQQRGFRPTGLHVRHRTILNC